jgi:hypothetical protein
MTTCALPELRGAETALALVDDLEDKRQAGTMDPGMVSDLSMHNKKQRENCVVDN